MEPASPSSANRLVGDWILDHKIGRGSFAVVWKARHRATGQVVAIKEIATDKLNQKLKQSLECEISILKRVEHRNIVRLFDTREERDKMYLIMEYCAGGDLAALIRRCKRLPEAAAHSLMRQLAAGLREMWAHNLVHRDLKPQNLLLCSSGAGALLKIADFGFARNLQPAGLAETLCGSPLYMAPEILQFQKYDAKADLWSVGTILYELLVGRPPFNGGNHLQLLRNIERSEAVVPEPVASQLSPACTALLTSLLQRNPIQRTSFEEFFSHPFLRAPLPPPSSSSPLSAAAERRSSVTGTAGAASPVTSADSAPTGHSAGSKAPAGQLPFELPDGDSDGEMTSGGATVAFGFRRGGGAGGPHAGHAAARPAPSDGVVPGQAQLQARLDALPGPGTPSMHGRGSGRRTSGSRQSQRLMEDTCDEDDYVIINSSGVSSRGGGGTSRESPSSSRRSSLSSAAQLPPGALAAYSPAASFGLVPARQRGSREGGSAGGTGRGQMQGRQSAQSMQQAGSSMARSVMITHMQALAKELRGSSRQDGWELVAYVLEGRAAGHQAAGRLAQALALRLLALQLLHAAVQEAKAGLAAAALAGVGTEGGHSGVEEMHSSTLSMGSSPAGSAPGPGIVRGSAVGAPMTPLRAVALRAQIERLAVRQRVVAGRAEKVGAALAERGEGELPEPWELAHQDALELARTAAVEETLGNHAASRDAYAQGAALLHFMISDALELTFEPQLRLPPATRLRLTRYLACLASRYAACMTVLNSDPVYADSPASVGLLERFA